jgi:predicted nucleotidyltransferase
MNISAEPVEFPALRDRRYPIHRIANTVEPYLRVIVERFRPVKLVLFGSQAYGQPDEHSDVDLLVVRDDITSEKQGVLEILKAFREVRGPRPPFTIVCRRPESLAQDQALPGSINHEIISHGLLLYDSTKD